jgi:beta-glucosidase
VSASTTNRSALASKFPQEKLTLGGAADLFYNVVNVSTSVTNTGSVEGAEVAQRYVSFPEAAAQPVRILRGFEKVMLSPNETAAVSFALRRLDLSYSDTAAQQWAIANGTYTFSVGSSSRDLRGNVTWTL